MRARRPSRAALPGLTDALAPEKKKSKYNNKIIDTEDGKFHSKAEYRHWCHLKTLAAAGMITDLRRQVRFPFVVNHVRVGSYSADFVFKEGGKVRVQDKKSFITRRTHDWPLRKKLMLACYGIEVEEV